MKLILINITILLSLLSLFSCATSRQLTREEWETVAQKKYNNIEKSKLIAAAESVMKLADNDDFKFSYTQNGILGSRKWLVYMVLAASMGVDNWLFEVTEKNGDTVASLQLSRQAGDMTGYSVGNSSGVVTTPNMGYPAMETASYDLFWRRLDYMLGLTTTWTSCKDEEENIKKKLAWGNISYLCDSMTIANNYPVDLSDDEMNRIFKNNLREKSLYLKKSNPSRWEEEVKKDASLRNP